MKEISFIVYGYQDKEKPSMWYIGKTICGIKKRDCEHRRGKRILVFDKFYRKYPQRYSLCILKKCISRKEMDEWEREMIRRFDSMWPNGYNFTTGGEYGFDVSEESRKKMSIAKSGKNHPMWGRTGEKSPMYGRTGEKNSFYGRHHSKETKEKMSIALCGKNHHLYGKHHPEETKKKMSEAKMGEKNPMFGKTGDKSPLFGRKRTKIERVQ